MQALQVVGFQFLQVLHAGAGRAGARDGRVQVTRCASALLRMDQESAMAWRFSSTVLMISTISLFLIMSTMCGRPSATLLTTVTLRPGGLEGRTGAARGEQREAEIGQLARHLDRLGAILFLDAT